MTGRWRWMAAVMMVLPGCAPDAPAGVAPGPTATPSAAPVVAASVTPSPAPPGGVPTPLPPVVTGVPTTVPSPVATSTYNALFTPGKAWAFAQTVDAGGKQTRSQVRVVVVEVTTTEATIAVQEAPFPSPGPGEVPGRRTRFALDAENPFEKWGTAGGDAPRHTSTGAEAVTVPAGAFPAATKFTYDTTALGYATHRELWVAGETGLVKLVSTLRPEGGTGPATSTTTWELERKP